MLLHYAIRVTLLALAFNFVPSTARPTGTSSTLDTRFHIPKFEHEVGRSNLDQNEARSMMGPLKPRASGPPQAFHLIGFDRDQSLIVRQAVADAQWMGQMGLANLNRITNANQMTPEFQTYFGNNFNTNNLDRIRNIVNNLATIGQNGILGFIYYSPTPHPGRPTVFFDNDASPNLDRFVYLPGDNMNFIALDVTQNRATIIAHEIMHYADNDCNTHNKPVDEPNYRLRTAPNGQAHITDVSWGLANQPGTPTYNGNFPTSGGGLYSPQNANSLAQFNQLAAMQNAANYAWYIYAVYVGLWLNRDRVPLIRKPNRPDPKLKTRRGNVVETAWEAESPNEQRGFVEVVVNSRVLRI
ncbi:hypothetical protein K469DRAFT_692386 [Zopfia rhizophila CBS 207.26]|uniref:Lysine-specific metallo-endopeptidase domain-containing protein n=1 Tax=Zopfia rhizophila CBS 207.26 TaxID=1314779 RepID=A0A6A6DSF1_9PEZI|nr:hypothetical protein K469DRAFT_692386 [Zopfia rhizophila CBS 207.26]